MNFYNRPRVLLNTTGSESSSSAATTNNNQVTSAGGTGSINTGSNAHIVVSNTDADVANAAIVGINNTANNAIANTVTATSNALQFGAETTNAALAANTAATTNALAANASALAGLFSFGKEALNSITSLATSTTTQSNATLDHIANQLGQITANAAPQTPAAQQEILAGQTPLSTTPASSSNLETWAVIGGFLVAAVALLKDK